MIAALSSRPVLRRLMRGLVLTSAYARASRWVGETAPEEKFFAVALLRPLTPMQMAASLKVATADPQAWPGDRAELEKRLEALEKAGERLAGSFAQPGDNFQVSVGEASADLILFRSNDSVAVTVERRQGDIDVLVLH